MMKILSLLLITLSGLSLAQDTGLYDPAPPANSAFVRVLNAPAATLGDKAITAENHAASPYIVIPQGSFMAKVGNFSSKLNVEAGKFYSVVQSGPKLTLLTDQATENHAKALLTIYNLSKNPSVDLKTADGKTSVINGVKPGESGSRAVNGITVDLAAFSSGKTLGSLKGVKLERGKAYALVLTNSGLTLTTSTTKIK